MSVTPHELLAAAQAIPRTDEASRRAIISRAYYAAFHAAFEFHSSLPSPGSVGNANGKHAQLIAQLSSPTIKSGLAAHLISRRVGAILGSLLAARVKADYYPDQPVSDQDVEMALFKAEDIFKQCYPPAKAAASANPQP
jgi:uncharacterized protein (UPF0332 family)